MENSFLNIALCNACIKSQEWLVAWKQRWKLDCHEISTGSSYDGICFMITWWYLIHSKQQVNYQVSATILIYKANNTLKIMSLTELLHKWCFCGNMWNPVMSGEHFQVYATLVVEEGLIKTAVQKASYQEEETWVMSSCWHWKGGGSRKNTSKVDAKGSNPHLGVLFKE